MLTRALNLNILSVFMVRVKSRPWLKILEILNLASLKKKYHVGD